LNIGCSEPVDEVFWVNLVKEWHALDLNRAAITVARKLASEVLSPELYSKLKFLVGDVTRLKFEDETYDVVTAFSSIDHIPGREDRRRAVSEMCRVLKKGGYLVITVPNKWDVIYSYRSNKLQRNGGAVYGYEYQFSPLELRSMLLFQGLSLIDSASTSFNPNSYFDWLLRKLGLAMLKIYFGRRFGYLARKL
jgi:ubiquinone/menaquinone biosynthesis C-methylase UbiE